MRMRRTCWRRSWPRRGRPCRSAMKRSTPRTMPPSWNARPVQRHFAGWNQRVRIQLRGSPHAWAFRVKAILYEVARDEIALRQLTLQWFSRSALLAVLKEAARRGLKVLITSDHGSIHCNTPATVFAKRDATPHLRYKFGEDLRSENREQALVFPREDALKLPRRGMGAHTLLATGDCFFVYPTQVA